MQQQLIIISVKNHGALLIIKKGKNTQNLPWVYFTLGTFNKLQLGTVMSILLHEKLIWEPSMSHHSLQQERHRHSRGNPKTVQDFWGVLALTMLCFFFFFLFLPWNFYSFVEEENNSSCSTKEHSFRKKAQTCFFFLLFLSCLLLLFLVDHWLWTKKLFLYHSNVFMFLG